MARHRIAYVLCLCILLSTLPCSKVTFAGGITVDFENNGLSNFICSLGGGVSIKEDGGNKFMSISPNYDGITAFAEYKADYGKDVSLEIGFDFMIKSYKNDGIVLASVVGDSGTMICVETYRGGVYYKNQHGNYANLINEYMTDIWYSMRIYVNAKAGKFSIAVNGRYLANDIPFINSGSTVKSVSFSTKYTPGFCIDNFIVRPLQEAGSITISGPSEIELAKGKTGQTRFSVKVFDVKGLEMKEAVPQCSIEPQDAGMLLRMDKGDVILDISDSVPAGFYTLRAVYAAISQEYSIVLKRYTPEAVSVKITGESKLVFRRNKENTYQYKATAYDKMGEPIDDCTFRFSLDGTVPNTISINPETGVVTVSGELPKDRHIMLRAELVANDAVAAEKKLTLMDEATYVSDQYRWETLLAYVDRVREYGRDPVNGSILIAKALNRYTMKPAVWITPKKAITPSNLAEQGNWFRLMEALWQLTGDQQYKREITETYQMYLDRYISDSGMVIWGGHACVNMDDLEPHYYADGSAYYHELKSHFPYLDPFFELNPEAARRICIATWMNAVKDKYTMLFNRHADYKNPYTEEIEKTWLETDYGYVDPEWGYNFIRDRNIPFRSAGNDLLHLAAQLYKHTREEPAKIWATRLLNRYYACSDPNTNMYVYQFTTADGAKGTEDPMKVLEPIGAWWTKYPLPEEYTWTAYGDRFKNQYADDLIAQGFVPPEKEWILRECFYVNKEPVEFSPLVDIELAKAFGKDSPEGSLIMEQTIKALGNYSKYCYDPERNKIIPCLIDGTSLEGFIVKRNGYFGDAGRVMLASDISDRMTLSYIKTYLEGRYRTDLQEHIDNIWVLIRNTMKAFGTGEPGIDYPGDRMNLDFACAADKPNLLVGLLYLYKSTGIVDYLDLARVIGNNIIANKMDDGFFVLDKNRQYIPLSGKAGVFPYSLALLEATIRGEEDNVPELYSFDGYYDDSAIIEDSQYEYPLSAQDKTVWYSRPYAVVNATDIYISENEITISPGEVRKLAITVEPDDADNKSLLWGNSNPKCVCIDYDSNTIIGLQPGTAEITISLQSNPRVKTFLTVKVE